MSSVCSGALLQPCKGLVKTNGQSALGLLPVLEDCGLLSKQIQLDTLTIVRLWRRARIRSQQLACKQF